MTVENQNVFAGAFVDRSGERRKDDEWLAEALESDDSRFVPVWRKQCLVAGDPPAAKLLTRNELGRSLEELDPHEAGEALPPSSARSSARMRRRGFSLSGSPS